MRRIERPIAERLDLHVEVGRHLRDLALGQLPDPELLNEFLDPPGRHPQQVTRGDHADEGLLGPPAVLQQPVREVAALPQLRDRQLDRAGPGVPLPSPVAVAGVHPRLAAFAVASAANRVRVGAHQRVGERLHHRPQHVRDRQVQLLAQHLGRVHTLGCGHRVVLLDHDLVV
jgi:hypothetical protein